MTFGGLRVPTLFGCNICGDLPVIEKEEVSATCPFSGAKDCFSCSEEDKAKCNQAKAEKEKTI